MGTPYPPQDHQPPQGHNPGPYSQQPHPGYALPPIVINNVASSSASAAAAAHGGRGYRKTQSVGVHVVLFLFTAGIGNIFYAISVSNWNKRHGW